MNSGGESTFWLLPSSGLHLSNGYYEDEPLNPKRVLLSFLVKSGWVDQSML